MSSSVVPDQVVPAPARQKPRGRHRSQAAEAAILKATLYLLDRHGLSELTADAIAKRAGVSKATLYKWWPNKNRVALDAMLSRAKTDIPIPDTGSAIKDFTQQVQNAIAFYTSRRGRATIQFLAESQNDMDLQKLFRVHFQIPRRSDLKLLFDRAVARGEIRADVDFELAMDLMFAPIVYRLFAGHMPVDAALGEMTVQALFHGISA